MSESDHPAGRTARLHRLVGLDAPTFRRADVSALAGTDGDRTVRWWRALGFPEVADDIAAFTGADIEIVRRLAALTGAGLADEESVLRIARLLGASFSRICEAQVTLLADVLGALPGAEPDATDRDRLASLVAASDESILDLFEDSLVFVWRRHLLAAIGHRLGTDGEATEMAVGFADLSGFTKLSQRLEPAELAVIVDRFETIAFDTIASDGGRAVKLIGDEVMWVAATIGAAIDIALSMGRRLAEVPDMAELHCGIAFGPTVAVAGDVFGPTVNLAARLTTIARRGTIVIPREFMPDVVDRSDLDVRRVRRSYDLKGIGDTKIAVIRPRVVNPEETLLESASRASG